MAHIFKHLFDDELRQLRNKPRLLGKGDKNIRREATSVRLGPARQRFCAHDFSATECHDGLIVNHKIPAVNGIQQAIARRLDTPQDPQDKQCGEQAYQHAER